MIKTKNDKYTRYVIGSIVEHIDDDDFFYHKKAWIDWVDIRLDIRNMISKMKHIKKKRDLISSITKRLNGDV